MTDEEYLRAAGWEHWTYANPDLLPDPGVWADPRSLDQARKLSLESAVAEQRRRDQPSLFGPSLPELFA